MIFSLAGVPPLGVFFAKLNIFISLVDASSMIPGTCYENL